MQDFARSRLNVNDTSSEEILWAKEWRLQANCMGLLKGEERRNRAINAERDRISDKLMNVRFMAVDNEELEAKSSNLAKAVSFIQTILCRSKSEH